MQLGAYTTMMSVFKCDHLGSTVPIARFPVRYEAIGSVDAQGVIGVLEKYKTALKRLDAQLDGLTAEYHRPKFRFWLDAFYCYLVHGASPRDYINFGFYRLNNLERKQFVTMKRSFRIERVLNPTQYAEIFNNKHRFNEVFSGFVNRRWIYAPESSKSEIVEFIRQVGKVVVKPTGLSSGQGIYVLDSREIAEYHDVCIEATERGYLGVAEQ